MLGLIFVMAVMMIGAAGLSLFFFSRARKMENQQQLPPGYAGTFTPARQLTGGGQGGSAHEVDGINMMNIPLKSIVSHFGTDYIVEGRLTYWEEGFTWITYMLVDGTSRRWLSVEEDDGLEVSLWDPTSGLALQSPPPEFIDYQGERFRMIESGEARVNQEGQTGGKTSMDMAYFEYEGEGDSFMSVERWGSKLEASVGKQINPAELEILPGDLVEF